MYRSSSTNFHVFFSLEGLWKVGPICNSKDSTIRIQGTSGHEPFFSLPNDFWQCYSFSGGNQMVNRTLDVHCEETSCPDTHVLTSNQTAPCQPCPEGQAASPDALMCGTCPVGSTRSPDLTSCISCVPGKFSDIDDFDTPCVACESGKYSAEAGAEKCHSCPAGTKSRDGAASLDDCVEILTCSPGTVKTEDSSDSCACDLDGIIAGTDTGKVGCADHYGAGMLCLVSNECSSAASWATSIRKRSCDPFVDNDGICASCPPGSISTTTDASTCEPCPAGSFAALNASTSCDLCPANTYNPFEGSSSCLPCLELTASLGATSCTAIPVDGYLDMKAKIGNGAVSAEASKDVTLFVVQGGVPYRMTVNNTVARTPFHDFDFRGCSGTVQDKHTWRKAYGVNNPTCTENGMQCGVGQYVNLDDFYFGSATTIEVYVKHDSYPLGNVFYASNTNSIDTVVLYNTGGSSGMNVKVRQGSTSRNLFAGDFDNTEWTHIVWTMEGTTWNVYENGVLAGSKRDAWLPMWKQRTYHDLGYFMNGTIGFFRMWKHTAYGSEPVLSLEEIDALYNDVNAKTSMLDIKRLSAVVRCADSDSDDLPCVFDGEGEHRIMQIEGPMEGQLKLVGLTLKNGHSVHDGGAVHISTHAAVSFERCSFITNEANEAGAIFVNFAENAVELFGCSFANNTAVNATRDIHVHGDLSFVTVYGWPMGFTSSSTSAVNLHVHGNVVGTVGSFSPPFTPCPVGKTSSKGVAFCTVCPIGTYSDEPGTGPCNPCGAGWYNPQTGSTSHSSCTKCSKGKSSGNLDITADCIMCPVGRYADEEGQGECTACGVGRYNGNVESRSVLDCQDCDAGSQQFAEAAASCEFASCYNTTLEDSFGDGWSGGELSFVNSGTGVVQHSGLTVAEGDKFEKILCFGCGCFTGEASEGSYPSEYSWMVQDSSGEIMVGSQGTTPAEFCVITAVCPSCGRGSGIQPSGICGVCPPGKYSDTDDVSFCKNCEPGRYNVHEGSLVEENCVECSIGSYAPDSGASECLECETGTTTGQALCSFVMDNTGDLIAAFGNGGASLAAGGGETYIAKAGITYTCSKSAGTCSDAGNRMFDIQGWFGFFECEEDLECTLDGQKQLQTIYLFVIAGTTDQMLHVRGFKMVNSKQNVVGVFTSHVFLRDTD
jgi:hypothetical protein